MISEYISWGQIFYLEFSIGLGTTSMVKSWEQDLGSKAGDKSWGHDLGIRAGTKSLSYLAFALQICTGQQQ